MDRISRYFRKGNILADLERQLIDNLHVLYMATLSEKHGTYIDEDDEDANILESYLKISPSDRLTSKSGKFFFGYLIEFVNTYGEIVQFLEPKDVDKIALNILKNLSKPDHELDFMRLCLLEYRCLSTLDSNRSDLEIFKDGIHAGNYDSKLILRYGFPEILGREQYLNLDDSWQTVHFPLLRNYLLTGQTKQTI